MLFTNNSKLEVSLFRSILKEVFEGDFFTSMFSLESDTKNAEMLSVYSSVVSTPCFNNIFFVFTRKLTPTKKSKKNLHMVVKNDLQSYGGSGFAS